MGTSSEEVQGILERLRDGEPEAAESLVRLLYGEIHRAAHSLMKRQPAGHTLQTTALVNEACARLLGGAEFAWEDRAHFVRSAGKAMRCVLIDHARKKGAAKRAGEPSPEPLDELVLAYEDRAIDLLAVHDALERLAEVDPELEQIVDLRFFAGLGNEEIAEALGISSRSVQRGWNAARAWLGFTLAEFE